MASMRSRSPAEDALLGSSHTGSRGWRRAAGCSPFGRESAAGQFTDAYADMHATAVIFPDVPDALRVLARHVRIGVVANTDHDQLMRCLDHNGLRFDLLVDSETAGCYKPEPGIFQ